MIQAFKEWVEPLSKYYAEALEFNEVDRVRRRPQPPVGNGSESGVPVEIRVTHVYGFDDGLITRLDEYDTEEEALAALGSRGSGGDA